MEWIEEQISLFEQIDWASEWQKIVVWFEEQTKKFYFKYFGSYEVTWQS